MKLSIVIVNWNSREYLRKCLETVRSTCTGLDVQVVVVDGGSFDGCGEMMAGDFPEMVFVQSADNIGFGRSNNLGFNHATGEAVLLLNPDTELKPGAVGRLLAALQEQKDCGMVGARLLNSDGTLQLSSIHHLPTPLNSAFDSDYLRRRWWAKWGPSEKGAPVCVEAVSGACMMMRSEVFRRVGGFSPQYFMYAEDMDLCLKVSRAGFEIYHAPEAVVVHHGGGSSNTQFSKFSTIMIREALHVYMRSNHGNPTALLYRILMGASAAVRLTLLAGLLAFRSGTKRKEGLVAVRKWWSILRWSFGLESWACEKFVLTSGSAGAMPDPSGQPAGVSDEGF